MNQYIGTKLINATPMNRQQYNDYRGWQLPADECGDDDGFLVEYVDGGKSNDSRHAGYISWSPKEVFERAYQPTDGMSFGMAIEALKRCHKVARKGWNGKGMFLFLIDGGWDGTTDGAGEEINDLNRCPFICMKTAGNELIPWLASQSDVLSSDWMIVQ